MPEIPGSNPIPESENGQDVEELLINSRELYDHLESQPQVDEDKTNELRKEYVDSLESIFQVYIQEFGQPEGKDPVGYVVSYAKLQRFINEHKIPFGMHYDLGYRFQIDSLLDDDSISPELKQRIKDILVSCSPHYKRPSDLIGNIAEDVARNMPRDNLIELITLIDYLIEKRQQQNNFRGLKRKLENQFIYSQSEPEYDKINQKLAEFPKELADSIEELNTDAADNSDLAAHVMPGLRGRINRVAGLGMNPTRLSSYEYELRFIEFSKKHYRVDPVVAEGYPDVLQRIRR